MSRMELDLDNEIDDLMVENSPTITEILGVTKTNNLTTKIPSTTEKNNNSTTANID